MPAVMGTAGHIDHGKTALIKALTGIDCDRLGEERRRGITIELGFAHLDLPDGSRLGIVDVPGHERFVKNMAVGAACIDFVLMVIAADEGVMPQTREHLDICTLLGLDKGLTVLTKADMADEELLELVRDDTVQFLKGSFLENAPMIPVSSVTGAGLEELKAAIAALAGSVADKPRPDIFRLPIDRVFTMRGHGTVITGTQISGQVSVGQEVRIFPDDLTVKVRGLQSHGQPVQTSTPGQRTAVNLQGVEVRDLTRGETLGFPGELFPHDAWDVELTCLKSSPRPLKHRTEVHFHHGSREIMARLFFPDQEKLAPGETALCQVRFPEPMVGIYGDRVVVRSFSPLRTVAGGRLVNPLGRKVKRFSDDVARLRALAGDDPTEIIETQLDLAGPRGLDRARLRTLTPLDKPGLAKTLDEMEKQERVMAFDPEGGVYVHGGAARELMDQAVARLTAFHDANPLEPGLPRAELAGGWGPDVPPRLAQFLVQRLAATDRILAREDLVCLPGRSVMLSPEQETIRDRLLDVYARAGLTPPNLDDALEQARATPAKAKPVVELLRKQGELVKVKDAMFFSAGALEGLKASLRDYFASREDMGLGDFKELTGLSRKYIIPLLEYLDQDKFTVRVGDARRLRKR